MTDPRIEAALDAAWKYTWAAESGVDLPTFRKQKPTVVKNLEGALTAALAAADAAACVRVVPMPIPAERLRAAQNTLLCWKSGALADEDAIGMIVCAVADSVAPPKAEVLG